MPARNKSFKPRYSEAERRECLEWFETHLDQLPQRMLIDASIATNELPQTVRRLISLLKDRHTERSSTYSGYFSILLRIREQIESHQNTDDNAI